MAIYRQRLTIYLYSAHRAVIFAIAQLSCNIKGRILAMRLMTLSVAMAIAYSDPTAAVDGIATDWPDST